MDNGNPPRHRRFYARREVAERRFLRPHAQRTPKSALCPAAGSIKRFCIVTSEENAPPPGHVNRTDERVGLGVTASDPEFLKGSDSDRNPRKLIEKFVFLFLDTINLIAIYSLFYDFVIVWHKRKGIIFIERERGEGVGLWVTTPEHRFSLDGLLRGGFRRWSRKCFSLSVFFQAKRFEWRLSNFKILLFFADKTR